MLALTVLLMPAPAQAIATCTAPYTNGPVRCTCLLWCICNQFGGGNSSQYTASWVNSLTGWKTWNNQEVWDSACNSNTVPASGDNVILGSDTIVTMDGNRTVNNFQLNGGGNQDNYLTLNNYNLTLLGNFTNNAYPEWNCGRFIDPYAWYSCDSSSSSMCEDTCDGHGWTIFNGSTQQTIGGTSATSFTYLEINNPAGVKLTANVTVTGRLKLTSGFIDTNGYSLKIYSDCGSYPILGSGYVLTSSGGPLVLNFQGGGTETCLFPVADGNGQANVTVTKYGTYKGTLNVSTSVAAPDTQANMAVDLTNNANHYWMLTSGSSDTYWDYAWLNGATWSTTHPAADAVSRTVSGLSTSATYDVMFQFCATAGTCTLTEKDGVGNGNVTSFVMVQNKTKVAGSGKWNKYAAPTNNGTASTTTQTGLTGAFGWFNVGVVDPGNVYAGVYGGIKLNWKATGDSGCGTACSKTAAASVLWLGHGVGASQSQATHWYGVTSDPGDTWTVTALGSNVYTIASTLNATCLAKGSGNTYLVMTACNSSDSNQKWTITAFSPSGETGGVSLYNAAANYYAHLVPTAGIQEMYVDGSGYNWKGVFFMTPPPPPDHFRFEFDKNGFLTCQPLNINIKACKYATATEAACTSLYPSSITLTPGATKGTWSGLTAAPSDTFTGSDGVTLADTTAEATTLSYSGATVTPTNATLECYDTSTSSVVSCTQAFNACSAYFDAVEKTIPVSTKGTNLFTKLAGTAFNFDVVGPPTFAGNVTVDLVDASAANWDCTAGAPTVLTSASWPVNFSAPSAANGVPIVAALPTIDAITRTRRNSFTAVYDNFARKVRVRILDDLGNCYNSTDYFSIRPASFALSAAAIDPSGVATAGTSANPNGTLGVKTGMTITATARNAASTPITLTGFTRTVALNSAKTIQDWSSTDISVLPNPSTSPPATPTSPRTLSWVAGTTGTGFGATVAGVATGTFYYNDFGTLTFPVDTVIDDSFTAVDQPNDCDPATGSNTMTSGKYGCLIGSASLTTPTFVPDHYEAHLSVTPRCAATPGPPATNAFSYMGDPNLGVTVDVMAANTENGPMTRMWSDWGGSPVLPTVAVTADNAGSPIALDAANSFALPYPPATPWKSKASGLAGGFYSATSNTTTASTAFTATFVRPTVAPIGPYDNFKLTMTLSSGKISVVDGTGVTAAAAASSVVPFLFRYGMLKLDNAYGSELLPLYVPMRTMYWAGSSSGWLVNTQDNGCTSVPASRIAPGNFKGALTAGALGSITTTAISYGVGSIRIAKPTGAVTGSAEVSVNLGSVALTEDCQPVGLHLSTAAAPGTSLSWLRGNWCGGSYAKDPSARTSFGSAKSLFLYRREKY